MMTQLKSTSSALRRHLQRFVEFDLVGVASWGNTVVSIDKKDPDNVRAAIYASGVPFVVRVQAPGDEYPTGQVFLDRQPMGPIDERTWTDLGSRIRAIACAPTAKAANG